MTNGGGVTRAGKRIRSVEWWRKEKQRRRENADGVRFKLRDVKAHMSLHHPNCPESIRHDLYRLIRSRRWKTSLGQAVGITMSTFVRHELTDYDRLLRVERMTRQQARRAVRGGVNDIIASWGPADLRLAGIVSLDEQKRTETDAAIVP